MGRVFQLCLEGSKIYWCSECTTHLAIDDNIISKEFQGRSGKAYLFDTVVNIKIGPLEERTLTTGRHCVADIYCNTCWNPVGWTYKKAHEESQKYKEGKYILELAKTNQTE